MTRIDAPLIDTPQGLADTVAALAGHARIALDCESNGMHAYQGRLCLVQLATAPHDAPSPTVYLVDTLALDDLSPLAALLGRDGPVKILHDLGFDARLLRERGIILDGVEDTAVHARYLGLAETGLGTLLAARCGVRHDKSLQRHDWSRRPLRAKEREYLAGDVAWLGVLLEGLSQEALARDVDREVAVETAYALSTSRDEPDADRPAWSRVKGAGGLDAEGRAVLRALTLARDVIGRRLDLPPGRVLPGAAALAMAKARPREIDAVRALVPRDTVQGEEAAWLAAIEAGVRAGEVPDDERPWAEKERAPRDLPARRRRSEKLLAWRREEAKARGVDPQVVLPGHCLEELAELGPRRPEELWLVRGLGGVRMERYGPTLLRLAR